MIVHSRKFTLLTLESMFVHERRRHYGHGPVEVVDDILWIETRIFRVVRETGQTVVIDEGSCIICYFFEFRQSHRFTSPKLL